MILRDIAHVRTGDKGDISQIAVFAYRPQDYPCLLYTSPSPRDS